MYGVYSTLSVPRGRTVPGPVELLRLLLSEHADGLLLEAAVELVCREGRGREGKGRVSRASVLRNQLTHLDSGA